MRTPYLIQLSIMALIIIAVNSMKHWSILILPDIFKAESVLRSYDTTFYIIISYMCYFYGLVFGLWAWNRLSSNISNSMIIFISLLLIGISNYLQTLSGGLKYMCAFRFIIGAVTNVQKLGKSFVHEFISRKNRKRAFQVENASYVLGSIAAPFIGYHLYNSTAKSFSKSALIISIFIIMLAIIFYIAFVLYPTSSNETEEDEERIAIIRIPTMVSIDFKSMLIHCFYTNVYSKYLILTYIINSACFHVDFVLTSTYFLLSEPNSGFSITKTQLAEANLIGSVPSIFLIMFLYKIVPGIMSCKTYIVTTIILSVLTTAFTPIIRHCITQNIDGVEAKTILCLFYGIKMLFNYYIYTNALVKEINTSVFKIYRPKILNIVNIVKLLTSAILFNITSTIMFIFIQKKDYANFYPYNHFVPFLMIAILQMASIYIFEQSQFRKKSIF